MIEDLCASIDCQSFVYRSDKKVNNKTSWMVRRVCEQGVVSGLPRFVSLEFPSLARGQARPTPEVLLSHQTHRSM